MNKKLQVFVSSTVTDLKDERQAAVEAILSAGHIPAGMEQFKAGGETQLTVIKKWIDESDVYLLILGGRYGSIDEETGKSYTHLEYLYAVEQKKPLFALLINEVALSERSQAMGDIVRELENPKELRKFRSEVEKTVVKFWVDKMDIKLAIHQTLSEFNKRDELVGWVRGNTIPDDSAEVELVSPDRILAGRQNALPGKWVGVVKQIIDKDVTWQFHLEITLEVHGLNVKGQGHGYEIFGPKQTYGLRFEGAFRNDKFLKLDYYNTKAHSPHFGTFILELSWDNQRLRGRFSGFGHISETVVYGLVEVDKCLSEDESTDTTPVKRGALN